MYAIRSYYDAILKEENPNVLDMLSELGQQLFFLDEQTGEREGLREKLKLFQIPTDIAS